jgi:hypothetical protein
MVVSVTGLHKIVPVECYRNTVQKLQLKVGLLHLKLEFAKELTYTGQSIQSFDMGDQ